MPLEKVLIDGEWRDAENPAGRFSAVDPATGIPCSREFPVSGLDDVERACRSAVEAVAALRAMAPEGIAGFLEEYAARIEGASDVLVATAARETALPGQPAPRRAWSFPGPPTSSARRRPRPETDPGATQRSTQRSTSAPGSRRWAEPLWCSAPTTSRSRSTRSPAATSPRPSRRGIPVIAKANTGHPETSQRLAELAFDAARATGMPPAMVQLIYRTPPDVGFRLVSHPSIGATGFTGSRSAGLQLKAAADKAGKPIYLEMSSANPVFVLPGALADAPRGDRAGALRLVRARGRAVLHEARHHRGRAGRTGRGVPGRGGRAVRQGRARHSARRQRDRRTSPPPSPNCWRTARRSSPAAGRSTAPATRMPTRCCASLAMPSWRARTRCRRRRSGRSTS